MCVCSRIIVARRFIAHQPIFIESTNSLTQTHYHLISYSIDILIWCHRTFSICTLIQHRHHFIIMPFKSGHHQNNRLTSNTFELEFFTISERLFGRLDNGLSDSIFIAVSLYSVHSEKTIYTINLCDTQQQQQQQKLT